MKSSVCVSVSTVVALLAILFAKPEWLYSSWTESDIPSLSGKVTLITGANTGLGFAAAKAMLKKGAHVILASRGKQRGEEAIAKLAREGLTHTELLLLDLSDLESVKHAAEEVKRKHTRLDHLILNAGLMVDPPLSYNKEGVEMMFATNHFGHYALTLHLLPLLSQTEGSRVVSVSSIAHNRASAINFEDAVGRKDQLEGTILGVYSETKLANILFSRGLHHRLTQSNMKYPLVVSAHPGVTSTELQRYDDFYRIPVEMLGMSPDQGCLSEVRAAVDPNAKPLDYFGPSGLFAYRGFPVVQPVSKAGEDDAAAEKLWELSERVTRVKWSDVSA